MSSALGPLLFFVLAGAVALVQWMFARRARAKQAAQREAERAGREAERKQRAKEERAFEDSARLLRAEVVLAVQVGEYNLQPMMDITLRVLAPEGAYDVDIEAALEPTEFHRFAKGCIVDVYVDPKNREHVKLCDPEIAKILRDDDEPG